MTESRHNLDLEDELLLALLMTVPDENSTLYAPAVDDASLNAATERAQALFAVDENALMLLNALLDSSGSPQPRRFVSSEPRRDDLDVGEQRARSLLLDTNTDRAITLFMAGVDAWLAELDAAPASARGRTSLGRVALPTKTFTEPALEGWGYSAQVDLEIDADGTDNINITVILHRLLDKPAPLAVTLEVGGHTCSAKLDEFGIAELRAVPVDSTFTWRWTWRPVMSDAGE